MPLNPGPPRKVLVGTSVISFWGDYPGPEKRVAQLGAVIDQMVAQAAERFAGGRLDLAVLPEFALTGGSKRPLADAALALDSAALAAMADKARQHRCYLLAPLHLVGDRPQHIYYNAAALFDRQGGLVGLYRYAHPSAEEISFGLTPGRQFPIFACDFGLVGVQICGDVAHDDGWLALAKKGAELILLPAQPPTPLLAALRAMTCRSFVVTSPWRGSATVFAPTGHALAQVTAAERILVERLDLSSVILGWHPKLDNGKLFLETYGQRAGFRYWPDDDCGLFWSNDPATPIMQMVTELGLVPLDEQMRRGVLAQEEARGGTTPL